MTPLSATDLDRLVADFTTTAVHLETRDAYGTEVELPHMAQWASGRHDDLAWLEAWCDVLRRAVADGKSVRRARIVSEPLSDYQRWSHSIAQPMVEAGEDIRWVPRRSVSAVAIPGNDFYLFDARLVAFLHYTGDGRSAGMTVTTDTTVVDLCKTSFEAVWHLSTPHADYQPH